MGKSLQKVPGYEKYFIEITAWYEQGANDLVNDLVSLGENRSSGRHPGATVLVILDDLPGVFNSDFEIQNGLHWLLENGAFSLIRPVASMDAQFSPANPFWIDAFRTFLVGKIASNSLAQSLGLTGMDSTKESNLLTTNSALLLAKRGPNTGSLCENKKRHLTLGRAAPKMIETRMA